MSQKHFLLFVAIILLLFIVPSITGIVGLISDWFWFQEIGFENIFTTILGTKIILGVIIGLLTFSFIYINFRLATHFTKGKPILIKLDEKGGEIDIGKHINKFGLVISAVLGFFTGLAGGSSWDTVLKYFNKTSFGILDPVFQRDISFYFFDLPFWQWISGVLFWIIFVSLIGAGLIYFFRGSLSLPRAYLNFAKQNLGGRANPEPLRYSNEGKLMRVGIAKPAKIHLSVLIFFLVLVAAATTYFIKIPSLLYSTTGPFTGASYTDLHATLPVLKILTFVLLLGALFVIINIFRSEKRFLFVIVGLYLGVSVIGGWLYPTLLQKFIVAPNELVKESPYIINNIAATQKAFGLDRIEKRDLGGETTLTMADIQNNQSTIKNIRLWDREPLLDTFGQIQEIRTYYDFISIDNDRYQIDGEYRQIMLSPRELNTENLPHRTFINTRLTFTHGFGIALGPVNEATKEGLPVLFIKDLPPVSTKESLQVTRPEIYFGELSSDYVFVKTKAKEFDYPSGEENVFTTYTGKGGVVVDGLVKKALFAARFNSLKILLSNDITPESRILYYRNIQERVRKVLPFLRFDSDPYLVVTDSGRLKWIYDAYTTSNRYPYAQLIEGFLPWDKGLNYIRNSLKVVIDAYDGEMQFYVADPADPLIRTYAKIFKGSFLSLEEMPEDLRRHLRYPEDIFAYQTALYTVYHMAEPQIFYNKEDQWQIPVIAEGRGDPMMRHIIMKLPGETKEEFILMIPFTPRGKDNLSAWMVARSDGENYGKLVVYRFPKQKLVFGPKQIINRINQDAEISRQISLWDQRGSEVILGNLLVIPIKESLLYVRPLYLRAEGGKIPELKRVIVAYENRIAMEKTLEESLWQIFEGAEEKVPEKEIKKEKTKEELIAEAKRIFDRALQAQKEGNWALYGQEIEALGRILNKLQQ